MPVKQSLARSTGLLACLLVTLVSAGSAFATNVIMQTPFGDVEIELFDAAAPATVANFLKYIDDGDFQESFIHRSVRNFIIQGGGYTFKSEGIASIPEDPPVINEPGLSNIRGTIAMAKLPGNPNSATSQWYLNLANNSANLDTQNGGFTVFGQVVGNGMAVIDAIAALTIWNAGAPFDAIPLRNYPGSGNITQGHVVQTNFTTVVENQFQINSGLNDAWFNVTTNGQGFFINVFPDAGQVFLAWFTYDTQRPDESVVAQLGDPGHRWLTAIGPINGNKAELLVELTQGGLFDASVPQPTQSNAGTITLEFSDCEHGTVSYDLPSVDLQGVVNIQRIALDNVARCEQLAVP